MHLMLELKSLKITPITKKAFSISWEFEPTIEKFSDFNFILEKSEAPHDGFEALAKIDPSNKSYIDDDIQIFKLWKNYYVRMKIVENASSKIYYSRSFTVEHQPNLEALELIRRTKISLENERLGNGVPCLIYIRKEGGQRCVECFDPIKRRSTKTNCINCYGTTYDGGFYTPITAYLNFTVDTKAMGIADHGNITQASNNALACNYPIFKSGDAIIDPRLNRVWTVISVKNIERRRHIVKQILNLNEEERTSILFELLARH